MPHSAQAANECGADAAGASAVTWTGNFASGINLPGIGASVNNSTPRAQARDLMQNGLVTTQGSTAAGVSANHNGARRAVVDMSGGTVSPAGSNADGILARSNLGTYPMDMSGGAGDAAAIHTSAAAGGTLNIGAGAVINGGVSGVAIRRRRLRNSPARARRRARRSVFRTGL